jgi:hypothetical protein
MRVHILSLEGSSAMAFSTLIIIPLAIVALGLITASVKMKCPLIGGVIVNRRFEPNREG